MKALTWIGWAVLLLSTATPADPLVQARSLGGRALYAPPLSDTVKADRQARLDQAKAEFAQRPDDPDALIWVGRRQAYLGDYLAAIDTFSQGIQQHPDDPRLFRHRGHRYITLRQFDRAIADLETARTLISGSEDQIEPDGLPNDRGIPTSTLHGNIHYHLGLAYYLRGRFDQAVGAYQACLASASNPDMEAAARYWLYLALNRAAAKDAATVLTPVDEQWDIIENDVYFRLLLIYRGDLKPDVPKLGNDDGIGNATLAYGLAMGQRINGDMAGYRHALKQLTRGEQWAAFGHIAAEADLHGHR